MNLLLGLAANNVRQQTWIAQLDYNWLGDEVGHVIGQTPDIFSAGVIEVKSESEYWSGYSFGEIDANNPLHWLLVGKGRDLRQGNGCNLQVDEVEPFLYFDKLDCKYPSF